MGGVTDEDEMHPPQAARVKLPGSRKPGPSSSSSKAPSDAAANATTTSVSKHPQVPRTPSKASPRKPSPSTPAPSPRRTVSSPSLLFLTPSSSNNAPGKPTGRRRNKSKHTGTSSGSDGPRAPSLPPPSPSPAPASRRKRTVKATLSSLDAPTILSFRGLPSSTTSTFSKAVNASAPPLVNGSRLARIRALTTSTLDGPLSTRSQSAENSLKSLMDFQDPLLSSSLPVSRSIAAVAIAPVTKPPANSLVSQIVETGIQAKCPISAPISTGCKEGSACDYEWEGSSYSGRQRNRSFDTFTSSDSSETEACPSPPPIDDVFYTSAISMQSSLRQTSKSTYIPASHYLDQAQATAADLSSGHADLSYVTATSCTSSSSATSHSPHSSSSSLSSFDLSGRTGCSINDNEDEDTTQRFLPTSKHANSHSLFPADKAYLPASDCACTDRGGLEPSSKAEQEDIRLVRNVLDDDEDAFPLTGLETACRFTSLEDEDDVFTFLPSSSNACPTDSDDVFSGPTLANKVTRPALQHARSSLTVREGSYFIGSSPFPVPPVMAKNTAASLEEAVELSRSKSYPLLSPSRWSPSKLRSVSSPKGPASSPNDHIPCDCGCEHGLPAASPAAHAHQQSVGNTMKTKYSLPSLPFAHKSIWSAATPAPPSSSKPSCTRRSLLSLHEDFAPVSVYQRHDAPLVDASTKMMHSNAVQSLTPTHKPSVRFFPSLLPSHAHPGPAYYPYPAAPHYCSPGAGAYYPPSAYYRTGPSGPSPNNKKAELYKTEMCRSWIEIGSCRYDEKCQFAHGLTDLRPLPPSHAFAQAHLHAHVPHAIIRPPVSMHGQHVSQHSGYTTTPEAHRVYDVRENVHARIPIHPSLPESAMGVRRRSVSSPSKIRMYSSMPRLSSATSSFGLLQDSPSLLAALQAEAAQAPMRSKAFLA